MDPLEVLLRPAARILNRNIAEMTPARELCAELDGTVGAIRVANTTLAMSFIVHADHVELAAAVPDDPDFVITGSLLTLARVAGGADENALRDGSIELTGNPYKAQSFQKLLRYARPDPEEELAGVIGDVAAHGIGRAARGVARWAREAGATMQDNLREYLQEEGRDVPSRYETERFARDLRTLRDDVERLAARIERLRRGRET